MSFTKAANQMIVSQQGISKIIGRMEEELSVPLFIRENAKLELTEYGKLLLNSALRIVGEYNSVIEQISNIQGKNKAVLNVYIPTGMINVFPLDHFDVFRQLHPEMNINLHQASDIQCESALASGKADVAFCALPIDTEVFTVHVMKQLPVYFLISTDNPLSVCNKIHVSQLQDEQFITIDEHNKCGEGFNTRCQKAGFVPNIIMRSSDTQLIYNLCQKNAGISFYIGEPASMPEGVTLIPEDPPNVWEVGLVTLTYRKPSKEAKEFIDFFKQW